jgi:hypothetical protein
MLLSFAKILVLFFLLGFLAGCNASQLATPTPTVQSSPTPKTDDLKQRFLKGIPCRPPCWGGITPGITTKDEALALLSKNDQVRNIKEFPYRNNIASISWNWTNFTSAHPYGGSLSYGRVTYDKEVVNQILLDEFPRIKFKEIIQAYGEPDYVNAVVRYDHHNAKYYYSTVILYPNQGFMMRNSRLTGKAEISLETEFERLYLFPSGLEWYRKQDSEADKTLVKWEGFREWKYYCRNTTWSAKTLEDCSKYPD